MADSGNIMSLVAANGRIKLTENQRAVLMLGVRHPNGVVRPSIHAGFSGVVTRKNLKRLEELGLITPSPHGDHYITDAGRSAIAQTAP